MAQSDPRARLTEIHIFPVKALGGYGVPQARVEACGLEDDRRWMVVEPGGRFITQRAVARMALVRARATPAGVLLSAPGLDTVEISRPGPNASEADVTVWRDTVRAAVAPVADAWISAALGQACRLVHLRDPAARKSSSAAAQPGETVSFADGFPVLLTAAESLAALNANIAQPVPISRFRANLVVSGAPAWAEDGWRVLRIGSAVFRVAKPCDRCVVTTIDQETGLRPNRAEPLKALGKIRHDERGLMFGQNLNPLQLGVVSVGDSVEVLETGPPNVTPI